MLFVPRYNGRGLKPLPYNGVRNIVGCGVGAIHESPVKWQI